MSQLQNLDRRPREVGQLKLGRLVPIGNGKTRPTKLDFFEVLKRGDSGDWVRDDALHATIGETPTSIRVTFFANKLEEVFHSELSLWRARSRGAYCKGDQNKAQLCLFPGDVVRFNEDGWLECHRANGQQVAFEAARPITMPKEIFENALNSIEGLEPKISGQGSEYWQCTAPKVWLDGIGCESAGCPLTDSEDLRCRCKPRGILRVNLLDSPKFGAQHVFRTGSWNSIQAILSTLEMVMENAGALGGIRYVLACQQENVRDRTGSNRKVTVAHLEVEGTLSKMIEQADDHARRRLSLGETQAALEAPRPIAEEEGHLGLTSFPEEFAPEIPETPEEIEPPMVIEHEDCMPEPSFDDALPADPPIDSEPMAPEDDFHQPEPPLVDEGDMIPPTPSDFDGFEV